MEEGFAKHHVTEEVIDIYLVRSAIRSGYHGFLDVPITRSLRSAIMRYHGRSGNIVNPAYETAMDLKKILEECGISRGVNEFNKYEFYVSDAAENSSNLQFRITTMMWETIRRLISRTIRRKYR